jgi:hypothetical protein
MQAWDSGNAGMPQRYLGEEPKRGMSSSLWKTMAKLNKAADRSFRNVRQEDFQKHGT